MVYSTVFGRGNVNIAIRYTIGNLVITKKCVNTHSFTSYPSRVTRVKFFIVSQSVKWCKCFFTGFAIYTIAFSSNFLDLRDSGCDSFNISVFCAYIFHLMMFAKFLCLAIKFGVKRICVAILVIHNDKEKLLSGKICDNYNIRSILPRGSIP